MEISSKGFSDIVDITEQVNKCLKKSGLKEGNITIFVSGSTAGVTSIEYEPGLIQDIPEALEKIAPSEKEYHHNATWGDGNGDAHVRAAFLGASFTVPFKDGEMLLGTWQQIVVVDCDNRSRQRKIIVQIIGKYHAC